MSVACMCHVSEDGTNIAKSYEPYLASRPRKTRRRFCLRGTSSRSVRPSHRRATSSSGMHPWSVLTALSTGTCLRSPPMLRRRGSRRSGWWLFRVPHSRPMVLASAKSAITRARNLADVSFIASPSASPQMDLYAVRSGLSSSPGPEGVRGVRGTRRRARRGSIRSKAFSGSSANSLCRRRGSLRRRRCAITSYILALSPRPAAPGRQGEDVRSTRSRRHRQSRSHLRSRRRSPRRDRRRSLTFRHHRPRRMTSRHLTCRRSPFRS